MQQISSRATCFVKRILPVIWLGGGTIAAIVAGVILKNEPDFEPGALVLMMLVQLILSYCYIKVFIFSLADEVWDCGDSLLIRYQDDETRISISDIRHVEYTTFWQPPRISIVTPEPSTSKRRIAFMPPSRLVFGRVLHPIAEDLLKRVKEASMTH